MKNLTNNQGHSTIYTNISNNSTLTSIIVSPIIVRIIIMLILLLALLIPNISTAASFNCQEATRELEKLICSNDELSQLDEYMANYYFKLKEKLSHNSSRKLLQQQRKWLKQRSIQCSSRDSTCLKKLYQSRILHLRKEYDNLVPYTLSNAGELQGIKGSCGFAASLPNDLIIYAGGSYSGKKIDHQIDQSGHQATQFEVIVNSPEQPVALILGAYEPSIWNLAWTQGTIITAVVATGYHRQVVAGLPKDTLILNSSYDNRGPCGYLYIKEKNLKKLHSLSQRVFGKNVNRIHYASKGHLVFGEQISYSDKLYTSQDNPPEIFFDDTNPPAGKAGLKDLVAKGLMRASTIKDVERWARLKTEANKEDQPPEASGYATTTYKPRHVHNGYVILNKITIPAGLYGGNSATFFLNEGVPYPDGELGHSTLYDFNSLSCHGTSCRR